MSEATLTATPATLRETTADSPVRSKAHPGRLRRLLLLAVGGAILVGAVTFGTDYWTEGRFQISTDDAYVQADAVIIAPKIAGYISQVLVADNQPVKAGQTLAVIDDRDYRTALDLARADVQAAQQDISVIEASLARQSTLVAGARANVAVDQANLTFAAQDSSRYEALAKDGAGSIQNAQQATAKRSGAQAVLTRDNSAVAAAEQEAGILQAQDAKAKAALAHTQAVEQQAELNLGYAKIVAPTDGVVGNRTLRVGQYVQGGTPLMAVVPVAGAYITANFKETQLTDVRPGQSVDIAVDSFPGTVVRGHVDSIAPASGSEFALLPPDNATGNFTKIVQRIPVKITLDADSPLKGRLAPGMSVDPSIDTKPADNGAHS